MKVELRGIHKYFGNNHANNDITLTIPSGTIQGILGENGAGKSTLMKILSGFIHADEGEILLDGKPVTISSPADAIRHGIGMLHQDPLDFPPMRVLDNFMLGLPGSLFPNRKEAAQDFNLLKKEFGFSLDPESYVDSLTVGERQQLEIMRLLFLGARVFILDEPTTGISAAQKRKLFDTLKKFPEQAITTIFVSHKLEDVEDLCDQVAVLRQGKLVGEMTRAGEKPFDTKKLVEMMFGKEIPLGARQISERQDVCCELNNVSIEDATSQDPAMSISKPDGGEVIGLAGMEGSGQDSFLRACAGIVRPVAGNVNVNGRDLTGKSYHAYKRTWRGIFACRPPGRRAGARTFAGRAFYPGRKINRVCSSTANMDASRRRNKIKSFNIKGRPSSGGVAFGR